MTQLITLLKVTKCQLKIRLKVLIIVFISKMLTVCQLLLKITL